MAALPSLCAVILAAGESSRMGRDKALLPWPPPAAGAPPGRGTFLSAAIRALDAESDMVIVVGGNNSPNLLPVVHASGAFLVANPAPERGQFSSLQVGLQEVLNRGRDAAMITLVDRPPARLETLRKLRAAFGDAVARGKWAVVPQHGDRHGHPYLVSRDLIEIFLKAPPDRIARDLEHEHQARIEYVAVDDPLVVANVDTPEEYQRLISA
jgi:molybdenum cofactor cytidylyltransferase